MSLGGGNVDLLGVEGRERLLGRLENYIDFERWGFHISHVKPMYGPIIFESSMCRILCRLSMERDGDEISISYGRVHAPNDDAIIEWNGQRCLPWHNLWVIHITEFLEGFSAAEVSERRRKGMDTPERIAFLQTDLGRVLRRPEWGIALEAFIWKRYGERLFSLFDLRQPHRWEELRGFVRQCYELRPGPENRGAEKLFGIPPWQIC
jgi:hypothetical protein